jgi:TonB family protein
MTKHLATQGLVCALCVLVGAEMLHAQGGSYAYQNSRGGTAVDIKGRRHTASEYPGQRAPWNFADRIAAAAPQYPVEARLRHVQGTGFFRIFIDVKTGAVTQVATLRSTGYVSLDTAAIAALRRWRWKPGTWKEVDVPVAFQMGSGPVTAPPPGGIALPH